MVRRPSLASGINLLVFLLSFFHMQVNEEAEMNNLCRCLKRDQHTRKTERSTFEGFYPSETADLNNVSVFVLKTCQQTSFSNVFLQSAVLAAGSIYREPSKIIKKALHEILVYNYSRTLDLRITTNKSEKV